MSSARCTYPHIHLWYLQQPRFERKRGNRHTERPTDYNNPSLRMRARGLTRQSNTAHPRQSLFLRKMSCLGCIYVRDRCKIRTVLKPSDSFEAGQTVLQLFISTTDGFKAVQTDEQLSWTVPKLCIKCTAARFSYIFVKIHVVQCATPPVLVIFS